MSERELARGPLTGLEAVTAFNAPVFQSHAEITATVRQYLGADTATLFATPAITGEEIAWTTDLPGRVRGWGDLSQTERDTLDPMRRQLGETLSDLVGTLRRRGTNTRLGNMSHLIETALVVPGVEHLHLVGDRPVLSFWGFRHIGDRGLDPLGTQRLIEPPPPAPPPPVVRPRRRWLWWLLLALLAALIGAGLWWWMASRVVPPPPPPPPAPPPVIEPPKPPPVVVPPPQPPPPEPPKPEPPKPPPPPSPPPMPPPKPAPPVDLPKQAWEQRDLSALEGCWVLGREYRVTAYDMFNRPSEQGVTRAARMCLDRAGHGTEASKSDFPSGRVSCEAPVMAGFGDRGTLSIQRPTVMCSPPRMRWTGGYMSCVRRDDSMALCTERGEHGSKVLEFRRAR